MKKENKYATGRVDKWHNHEYDYAKVFEDLKKVVLGKKKFTKDLYEVMYLRFTIAHYDMVGWFYTYNGNWGMLANEIDSMPYGGFEGASRELVDDIRNFLNRHNSDIAGNKYNRPELTY